MDFQCVWTTNAAANVFQAERISFAWACFETIQERRPNQEKHPNCERVWGQRSQGLEIIKGICGMTGWREAAGSRNRAENPGWERQWSYLM